MEEIQKKQAAEISRRKFIGGMAALSAFMIVPRHVLGGKGFLAPSDRVNLGFIAAGRQAHALQQKFFPGACQITAVCDVYGSKAKSFANTVNKAYAARLGQNSYEGCRVIGDFTELITQKDIDAVVVAAPDHWHAAITVRAAAAGKDIYSEKPLSLTVVEGRAMVDAVSKHKRVFQTGSMQRSSKEFRQCVELIRNGYIGELKLVEVNLGNPPIPYDLPEEPLPADLDWKMWLGPNEFVHYNHQLNPVLGDPTWGRWRDFKGLGGGDITDWGAHMFDIVQWALDMDRSGPVEVLAPGSEGNKNITFKYANGLPMRHVSGEKGRWIRFTGSDGVIDVQRNKLTLPEKIKDLSLKSSDKRVYFSDNHYDDFLQAIKTRKQPISDVEAGHRSCTVCNIGNIAYELNRSLKWDPKKEKFTDAEANKLLSRKMKKEWVV